MTDLTESTSMQTLFKGNCCLQKLSFKASRRFIPPQLKLKMYYGTASEVYQALMSLSNEDKCFVASGIAHLVRCNRNK